MKFESKHFECPSCGAFQTFSPANGKLSCGFCNTQTEIPESNKSIDRLDLDEKLASISIEESFEDKETSCDKCGASFDFKSHAFATHCPYCDVPAIIDCTQDIKPKSLIPFIITRKDAKNRFKKWVSSRWFAPNAFKKYLSDNKILKGYYLPHWLYDSDTISYYTGERGRKYYVTVTRTVEENGKSKQVTGKESRIDWTYVSGVVNVNFDDVVVPSSPTIDRDILDDLEPWDTKQLISFDSKYISGFEAEEYSTNLQEGFDIAKDKMSHKIDRKVRQDIGGDEQRVHTVNSSYNNNRYKNTLLPIWTASFSWNNRDFNYAINAQTGKIVGERPYSIVKIVSFVISVGVVVASVFYYEEIFRYFGWM
ncbi:MAG: hypothetical protein QM493_03305 [Sulfurovum sp.]